MLRRSALLFVTICALAFAANAAPSAGPPCFPSAHGAARGARPARTT